LAQYYQDFNRYPVSSSVPQPFPQIAVGRGGALLAQGLVGYLEQDSGPTLADGGTTNGFRVTPTAAAMGGKVFGPYVALDPKQYKIWSPVDQYFIDPWGKEILYYKSNFAVVRPAMQGKVTRIFKEASMPAGDAAFFDPADCSKAPDASNNPDPTTASPAFFQLLGSDNNTVKGTVTGADSYLLISAGPDMVYFTKDDIVSGK
jgi:hypothetical protein